MAMNQSAVFAQKESDRTINTTYYVDSRRLEAVRIIRSKIPRSAVMRAIDYMRFDYFTCVDSKNKIVTAMVAVVHDEEIAKDLCIISKDVKGRLTVDELVNAKKYEAKKFGAFKIRPDRIPKKE